MKKRGIDGIKQSLKLLGMDLKELDMKRIVQRRRNLLFLMFASFLISFALARIITAIFVFKHELFFIIGTYHIHHFYYGIILLITASFIGIISYNKRLHYLAAVIFGTGLGVLTDEVGLLLSEMTDYWAQESYTAGIILVLVFLCLIFFNRPWFEGKIK